MSKPFSWSYSKLKAYETCPKRYYEVELTKHFVEKEEPGGPLAWGNRVHKAIADALSKNKPLPPEMQSMQKWVDKIKAGQGTLYVEQKYALTKDFQKTSWYGDDAWYRGIGDVVVLGNKAAHIIDWKTGKLLIDSIQLMLMAQCIFTHFPAVQTVHTSFVWLKEDRATPETFTRQQVADEWVGVLQRVYALETATVNNDFPPKPGRLCRKWCPVKTCVFHGKGNF